MAPGGHLQNIGMVTWPPKGIIAADTESGSARSAETATITSIDPLTFAFNRIIHI